MKRFLFLITFAGICTISFTQVQDNQLWAGPVLRYDLNDRLRFYLEQQFRFKDNISKYDFTYTEFALRYTLLNYLDLKGIFRHSFIPGNEPGSALKDYDRSRINLDASTGTEVFNSGLKVGYRLRYQHSWENTTRLSSNYLRNRIDLEYNLSKLADPYAEYENFFRFDNRNEFRQHRYTLGMIWRITGELDLDTYFRYQYEINVNNPETDYIIGLGIIYSIN